MGRVPGWMLRHTVTVRPYLGVWNTYGPAQTVRCFVDERMATAAVNAGVQRVSTLTVIAAPSSASVLVAGSRVTLADGRAGYVSAVAVQDGGGLPTPDHVQAAVTVAAEYGPANAETVVLLRRALQPTRDRYGNDRYATTEVSLPAAVRPLSSQETLADGRDRVVDAVEVILPPGTVVTAADGLRVRGLTYEVDGTPDEQVSNLTGVAAGVRVVARRVTG